MTIAFVSLPCPLLDVAGRLIYCRRAAKTGTYRPFLPFADAMRAANAGIKLSSAGTLATFFSQKHDIALITPMTKLVILEYPDPRLRKKAATVPVVDDAVRQLVDNMLETMYAANGVGLAATQVDVHQRLIVLDVSEERDRPLMLINPQLLKLEGSAAGRGGLPVVARHLRQVSRARRRFGCARWAATASRSRWMRMACWPSASSMRWIISTASYSSITCPSSSAS